MSLNFLAAMNKSPTPEEFIEKHLAAGLREGAPRPLTQHSSSNRFVARLERMLRDPEGEGRRVREIMFVSRTTGEKCLFGIERTRWRDPRIIQKHAGEQRSVPFVRLFNNVRLNIPLIDWENCVRHTGIAEYPHGNGGETGGEQAAGGASAGGSGHPRSVTETIPIPVGNFSHWPGWRLGDNRPELAIVEVEGKAFDALKELGEPMDFLAAYRDSISLLNGRRSGIGYAMQLAKPEDEKFLFDSKGELKGGTDPIDYFLSRHAKYEALVSRLATIAESGKGHDGKMVETSKAISEHTALKGAVADAEASRTFPLINILGGIHARVLAKRMRRLAGRSG